MTLYYFFLLLLKIDTAGCGRGIYNYHASWLASCLRDTAFVRFSSIVLLSPLATCDSIPALTLNALFTGAAATQNNTATSFSVRGRRYLNEEAHIRCFCNMPWLPLIISCAARTPNKAFTLVLQPFFKMSSLALMRKRYLFIDALEILAYSRNAAYAGGMILMDITALSPPGFVDDAEKAKAIRQIWFSYSGHHYAYEISLRLG